MTDRTEGQLARSVWIVDGCRRSRSPTRQGVYLNFDRPQRLRIIVTDQHRMTVCRPDGYSELYDLRQDNLRRDPCEAQNLWREAAPTPLMYEMQKRLMELLVDCDDWTSALNSRA